MMKDILHCDLNNFYASIECILKPELKNFPVAVCGDPEKRHGIVLAKNNIAKSFGIKTAETIFSAKKKCPGLICVPPHHDKYLDYSEQVKAIYYNYTDMIEPYGIDECWLDVTGSLKLFKSAENIAESIRSEVKQKTGLTVSIGVSFTKVFAKLGSDLKKPDAVTVITRENYKEKIYNIPVAELFMIGKQTAKKLVLLNINTIGELAEAPVELLMQHFGINGKRMKDDASGIEQTEVNKFNNARTVKSIGHGVTTARDVKSLEDAKTVLYHLAELTATRLRKYGFKGACIAISLRDNKMFTFSRQISLDYNFNSASEIAKQAFELLKTNYNFDTMPPLRTISLSITHLKSLSDSEQLDMFADTNLQKNAVLENSIDKIRLKYGYNSIQRGLLIENTFITDRHSGEDDFLPFKR